MLITSRSGCRIHLRASAVRHHHSEAIRAEEGSCISRRRGICPYPKRPKLNKQERKRRADSAKLSGDPNLGPIELMQPIFRLLLRGRAAAVARRGTLLAGRAAAGVLLVLLGVLLVLLGGLLLGGVLPSCPSWSPWGGRRHLPLLLRLLWPGSAVPTTCAKNRP